MDLTVLQNPDVTPELDREIRRGLCECFPPDVEYYPLKIKNYPPGTIDLCGNDW